MQEHSQFRRNLIFIGGAHVLALVIFVLFSLWQPKSRRENIAWIGGDMPASGGEPETDPVEPPDTMELDPPPEIPTEIPPIEPETPPSEIVTSTPAPSPTPKPTPTPTPKVTPSPTPKITPKPTPKVTPKPTAKPRASATAKKSPAAKASAKASASARKKPGTGADGSPATAKTSPGTKPGGSAASGSGTGKNGNKVGVGSGPSSDSSWYYSMIHDRFYGRWDQPTSIITSDQKFVTTVRIKIEKDGRISNVSLAKSSGNVVMDESVMAAAQRVSQIEALPAGLGNESLELNMNFELNQNK